jgi:ElaB/YqjD/DUF883 family membrane-anchored ribosome-binding protein
MPNQTTTTDELGGASALEVEPGSTRSEDPMVQTGQETAQRAGQLAERAKETGLQQANTQMTRVADTIQSAAGAIRRAGSDMGEQQPAIQNVATTVAERAEQFSQYLRQTDAREILHNAEDFARRQPLLVVGGAFVVGLLAARFLKASATQLGGGEWSARWTGEYGTSRYGLGGYGTGYGTGYGSGTGYASRPGSVTGLTGTTADYGAAGTAGTPGTGAPGFGTTGSGVGRAGYGTTDQSGRRARSDEQGI